MGLLELLIVIVLVMWLAGFSLAVGGNLIHLLLLIVLVLIVVRLAQGRNL